MPTEETICPFHGRCSIGVTVLDHALGGIERCTVSFQPFENVSWLLVGI